MPPGGAADIVVPNLLDTPVLASVGALSSCAAQVVVASLGIPNGYGHLDGDGDGDGTTRTTIGVTGMAMVTANHAVDLASQNLAQEFVDLAARTLRKNFSTVRCRK